MKKAAIIIVLAIALPLCLFAENWFTLSFNLAIESSCTSVFWNPTTCGAGKTPSVVAEVDVTDKTDAFATLGIVYTGSSLVDIAVAFSPLYLYDSTNQTMDTSVTCPYNLSIFQPGQQMNMLKLREEVPFPKLLARRQLAMLKPS